MEENKLDKDIDSSFLDHPEGFSNDEFDTAKNPNVLHNMAHEEEDFTSVWQRRFIDALYSRNSAQAFEIGTRQNISPGFGLTFTLVLTADDALYARLLQHHKEKPYSRPQSTLKPARRETLTPQKL